MFRAVEDPYDVRQIVAANLAALIEFRPELSSPRAIERAARSAGGEASRSTIERMMKMLSACDIETLSAVARAFGLLPWQLLIPGLNPSNPQVLRENGKTEAEFYAKMEELIKAARGT